RAERCDAEGPRCRAGAARSTAEIGAVGLDEGARPSQQRHRRYEGGRRGTEEAGKARRKEARPKSGGKEAGRPPQEELNLSCRAVRHAVPPATQVISLRQSPRA